jgi:HK97 gp10 family phage protein
MAEQIHGHEEVMQRLRDLDEKTEKQIFRVGLKAGANVVLPVAESLAPERSGRMRANLKVRNGGSNKKRVRISVGASAKDFSGPAFYTGFVLWGHKIGKRIRRALLRIRPELDARKTVPGDDFIKHAYDETKQAALDTAMSTMAQQIESIASGKQ